MTEFFDTTLPGVLGKHNMTVHVTPKFSDLRDNEFVRLPFEVRYGVTDDLEMIGGISPFAPNPINTGRDHRWGPGEAKLGARYDLDGLLRFFDDTTVGLEMRIPIGKPPTEINDHYTHVKPFVSAARKLLTWPDTTFYANLAYDRSVNLTDREPSPPWVMRRNIIEVAPGLLFKPSELGYFSEYRFRHISEPGEWHLAHQIHFLGRAPGADRKMAFARQVAARIWLQDRVRRGPRSQSRHRRPRELAHDVARSAVAREGHGTLVVA
jgi:hypothetical protein